MTFVNMVNNINVAVHHSGSNMTMIATSLERGSMCPHIADETDFGVEAPPPPPPTHTPTHALPPQVWHQWVGGMPAAFIARASRVTRCCLAALTRSASV